MLPLSHSLGKLRVCASGQHRQFRSSAQAIQEFMLTYCNSRTGVIFQSFFFSCYFLHFRFLKTRNRWDNPGSSEQTAYQTACVEAWLSSALHSSHRIIPSDSIEHLQNFTPLAFPWSHYPQLFLGYPPASTSPKCRHRVL